MEADAQISEIIRSFAIDSSDETRLLLRSLRPQEIANLLASVRTAERQVVWGLLGDEVRNQTLQHLGEDIRVDFLVGMGAAELAAVAEELDTDDFADILQELPQTLTDQVLGSMDAADRARVEEVLAYPDDTAGGLMNTDTITVRPRHAIEIVLRYLRLRKDIPDATDALIVVNSRDEFVGLLQVTKLLTSDPTVTVREIMDTEIEPIQVTAPDTEVARIFAEQDLVSAPVVDTNGKLLGRITIDDVVDVIIEDAGEALLAQAGLDVDEDTFAPIGRSARSRAVWLGINLMTAFLASAVISVFEDTIAKVVALAILMPIVASMGGIAGTQTLTIVVRGMALGHIRKGNLIWLMNRELAVSILNGLLWASLVAIAATVAFQDTMLGLIIAIAMIANMLVAALAGSLLPNILQRLGIDPAIAGGVILTTITDVAGFCLFLGLATWAYA
ncbi:MAG: magnesium transporter [Pseudomonadaceae bacterium]|nr:magnesium transporter [Pseudomonadaceae bacterium]